MTTLLLQVTEQLEQLDTDSLVTIYNDYADANSYERIQDNDEHTINECYGNAFDAIKGAVYGDYNPSDAYFIFNGAANLESFSYETDNNSPIHTDELASWIISEDNYNDYDIEVVTIDDKYNAILDYVNDIDSVADIQSLLSYLGVEFLYTNEWIAVNSKNTVDSYIEKYVNVIIAHFIDKNDSEQLDDLIEYLGIDL